MARKKNAIRADNRIPVQVYLGMVDGKRKYKTVYGYTQKEADAKADELKSLLGKGVDITSDSTFKMWSERWLKYKSANVSNSQASSYAGYLKHINGYIGHKKINKINYSDIEQIITSLAIENPNTKKPSAKKTLNDIKITAKQVFDYAIRSRAIDYNPAVAVEIPKSAPREHRRALTKEEQSWIVNTPHRAQRAAMIMMYAGLRRGEVIPLTWSDIDLKEKTININKSVEIINSKSVVKPGAKSDCSTRIINIPNVLVNYLKEQKKDTILVCTSVKKTMMSETAWTSMWDSYILDLNLKYGDFSNHLKGKPKSKYQPKKIDIIIPKITSHWLRHTFATMLYFAGVDVLTAKDQLGHSDVKTTLGIYTHLDKIFTKKSMTKLDEYLSASQDASQTS